MPRKSFNFSVFKPLSNTFLAVTMAVIFCISVTPIAGQEFKIESQVYMDQQTTPIASTVTLFQEKLVFDISIGPDGSSATEVVIFDSRNQSFELIDVAKERRVHLEQFEIVRIIESLRQQGAQDERLLALIEPNLQETIDLSGRFLRMANSQLVYEAKCESPTDVTLLPTYFEFLDQYTRLAATDPRRMPPFARLELNQAMKKHGWMPKEINLKLEGGELSARTLNLTSKHQLIGRLSDQDKKRIELARRQWLQFKQVSLSEYRDLPKVAEAPGEGDKRKVK
ncbi:MAG: hypothetical protein KF851_14920 [Pirellulaceae bacterium]|nr:hypothetical protein [Pirellulaceae bacterium]